MEERTYTTFDIARLCDVYPTTVADWIDQNKLKAFVTPGGHRRVKERDLVAFLKQHKMAVPRDLGGNKTILIVDDEPEVLKAVRALLKTAGEKYEILTAEDGFQAGQAVSEFSPDLVILDIMLPGIDGFKVCELIKKKSPLTKIIAMTGYNTEEHRRRMKEKGADAFLAKPFGREDLFKIITRLLDEA